MKVLVVGSGGREHAFVWKLAQSPLVTAIICAPGNAGIDAEQKVRTADIKAGDVDGMVELAVTERIDLVVIGPEDPLTLGMTDKLEAEGLAVAGPSKQAAELEGSKVFAKEFMAKHDIPTADFAVFSDYDQAKKHLDERDVPLVVKADGLAAGKGVYVCKTVKEAEKALDEIMVQQRFGEAGDRVIIEDCLIGEEASYIVFTDGQTIISCPSSQDHKAVFDGDTGANTGGMGAYSPAPVVTPEIERKIMDRVIKPTVDGMATDGRPYKGILYAGLMIDHGQINVLEYNCRMGDPEAQPILMLLKSDIYDLLSKMAEGKLDQAKPVWRDEAAVCVVLASEGYPGHYETGMPIFGLDVAAELPDTVVFHAGTIRRDRRFVTAGGRVVGVTSLGKDIKTAIDRAYRAADAVKWDGQHRRSDIGQKALNRE